MAISYPLTLPTVSGIQSITLFARNTIAITTSPYTYKQQILKHSGARWEADVTLAPMKRADADEWNAFLTSLNGQFGTFLLGDPLAATPRGSAGVTPGTPLVNGGSQTGNILAIDGCPTSVTGYLKAGDYIQLGAASTTRLYRVLADVNTNENGEATIDIWPDLRESPSNNAAVTVTSTKGLFRLSSNESSFTLNNSSIYGISFGAVEAI
jgi:hypothetical protein